MHVTIRCRPMEASCTAQRADTNLCTVASSLRSSRDSPAALKVPWRTLAYHLPQTQAGADVNEASCSTRIPYSNRAVGMAGRSKSSNFFGRRSRKKKTAGTYLRRRRFVVPFVRSESPAGASWSDFFVGTPRGSDRSLLALPRTHKSGDEPRAVHEHEHNGRRPGAQADGPHCEQ